MHSSLQKIKKKNCKPRWWTSQIKTGLLHKNRGNNIYLASSNKKGKIEYEKYRKRNKNDD